MRNIYLAQPNYLFGENVYLPYSVGLLAAAAFEHETIKKEYKLKDIFFIREDINKIADSLENPFLVGFSCYIWNYEYNKALAKLIKKKYPSCIILFGGHQIKDEFESYIDIIAHGEGEVTFVKILLELLDSKIQNIYYRDKPCEEINSSPYLQGIFDDIILKYPKFNFNATLETNRGCPFGCAYCDWGGGEKKLRTRDINIIKQEIDWMAKHKISYIMGADANFGILERDNEIVDYLIQTHKTYGYPQSFRVAYTKNSTKNVFELNRKLNEYGMAKGATLSFQSFNKEALTNIGRKNIKAEEFLELITLYNQHKISTYSELIIGLPGETYDSLCSGFDILLNNGQHTSINAYNCEVLINSQMGSESYRKQYDIQVTKMPLNQYHMIFQEDDIIEYSYIATKTYSMSQDDWVRQNMYAWIIQYCHCLGLLQMFAIYLHYEKNINYSVFYNSLLDFCKQNKQTIIGRMFTKVENIFKNALLGDSLAFYCDNMQIVWPPEEGAFIETVKDLELFYNEIQPFLSDFNIDIFHELLTYQKHIIKALNKDNIKITFDYDWYLYFNNILCNKYIKLEKKKNIIQINTGKQYNNIQDYAINIVWYGRKGGKNLYNDVMVKYI